jgi:hypothetical protein
VVNKNKFVVFRNSQEKDRGCGEVRGGISNFFGLRLEEVKDLM